MDKLNPKPVKKKKFAAKVETEAKSNNDVENNEIYEQDYNDEKKEESSKLK